MVRRLKKESRRGAATVEMAIVLPLLLMLTLGAIRYGWLFLKAQEITNATRMGARIAVLPDATVARVQSFIDTLFAPGAANITGATVTFTEAVLDIDGNITGWVPSTLDAEVGVPIKVKITVPHENVDIMPVPFVSELEPAGWCLGAEVAMAKEGY